MNKEDYKAISKVVKDSSIFTKNALGIGTLVTVNYSYLIFGLADYFEKEYLKRTGKKKNGFYFDKGFDKDQFLKECGVEL